VCIQQSFGKPELCPHSTSFYKKPQNQALSPKYACFPIADITAIWYFIDGSKQGLKILQKFIEIGEKELWQNNCCSTKKPGANYLLGLSKFQRQLR
jgi:hypothetical protein